MSLVVPKDFALPLFSHIRRVLSDRDYMRFEKSKEHAFRVLQFEERQ
jgi:hypothetical protein